MWFSLRVDLGAKRESRDSDPFRRPPRKPGGANTSPLTYEIIFLNLISKAQKNDLVI